MLRRVLVLVGLFQFAACGANHVSDRLSCGPGTTQTGDVCLPADTTGRLVCGAGTHEEVLACVPDAPSVTCGVGTERQGGECVALEAGLFDLRLFMLEVPADGVSKIPVLAVGRLVEGTPTTEDVVFGLSRPNAGSFIAPVQTLTPMGVVGYFTPCDSLLTPSCTGAFSATLALASAPATLVARSVSATLLESSGVGSPAACLTGGNVLFLDGDVGDPDAVPEIPPDPVHPGIDAITLGVWSGIHLGGAAPTRVQIGVEPTSSAQGTLWTATFSTEELGLTMTSQVYDNAQRVDFAEPGHPGLEVIDALATCNTLTGRFQIHELEITGGTTLTLFSATFEQHCDGGTRALRGCVRFAQ
jgi:hypothetical protein